MSQAISFVRVGSYQREARRRFGLLLGVSCAFAVYKLAVVDSGRGAERWLGMAVDTSVWALLWLTSEAVAHASPRWAERVAGALFYPALYLSAALVFAHTWFFDAAVERRLTALDVSFGGIAHFFRAALPPMGYLALALVLLGTHLVAYLASVNFRRPPLGKAAIALLPLLVFAGFGSARAPRTPSVLFDTGAELWQLATQPRLEAKAFSGAREASEALDKSEGAPPTLDSTFTKIVVLVMETMTERKWRDQGEVLAADTFLHAGRAHTHRYTRYFPNNQDSRTGMLNMLTSRLIPYEAYGEADLLAYEALRDHPSLVDDLKRLGYRSAFAVSQVALEEVVSELHWDQQLRLSEQDIARAKSGLLCLQPDEYENGCEDLALLPKILEFLRANERAFVYQELIWGHASQYNEASGKSDAAYYSNYADWLIRALSELELLDQTLIVLTSDHGFRDKSRQSELWVYQIPLLFYATRFSGTTDQRLFSHTDFKHLLFDELSGTARAQESQRAMIVGPTGSGMLSSVEDDGGFVLLRRRGSATFVLAQQRGQKRMPAAAELLYLFEHYRSSFDARLRASQH